MSPGLLLQVLVTGLAAGAAYGLVGLGFALVYRLTGVLQLAHGDIVGAATFLVLALVTGTGPVTRSNVGFWPLLRAAAAAVVLAALAGAGLYLGLLRPFYRRRSTVGWIGVVVAVAFAIEGVLAAAFPREGYVFPDILPGGHDRALSLGRGASIPVRTFWLLAVAVVVAVLAWRWLATSSTGRAMAAVADDPLAAEIVGLPVDRLVAIGFALATGLAAVAGIVVAPAGPLTPQTGLLLGLKGISAALAARFGSPLRVLAAGLALGVLEAAVTSLSIGPGPEWRDITPLLVAVVVIAVRSSRTPADAIE
jgi:branched-subunit amino acid ABC-type transport system permease component